MMVHKRPNYHATMREQRFQRLPKKGDEIEQLVKKRGIQTRRTARARQLLKAQTNTQRSQVKALRDNRQDRMPIIMTGASNSTSEQQEIERMRQQMQKRDRMITEKDAQLVQLTTKVNALLEMMNATQM
jgi:hypothetical protein